MSDSVGRVVKPASQRTMSEQEFWALQDINFELAQGEALGLIGKNGAGKSTLLKLLANITRPSSGQITINGRTSALIELGSGFHQDLTGRENIYLNGTILGLRRSEIKRRFDEIVAFSEIERFIDTPLKRYSSGMMVRLGFAVASCIEPDILLVDEVLAVGDAAFRQKCMKRIYSLQENGTGIIFVSHNINMIQAVCSSALYIRGGQVRYAGNVVDAADIYERDLHEERLQTFHDSGQLESDDQATDDQATAVCITQIDVVDEHKRPAEEFRSNQPLEIRVHYEAFQRLETVNAVVRIIRADGLVCCRMRTTVDEVPFSLEVGEGAFSLMLEPLQLTGGKYYAAVSIRTERDLVRLATKQSQWFHISSASFGYDENNGVFEPNRRWVHHSNRLQPQSAIALAAD